MPQQATHTSPNPVMEAIYRLVMRRNSVYIAFVLTGAVVGERIVNYSIDKLWEHHNQGKLYKHLEGSVIGGGGSAGGEE